MKKELAFKIIDQCKELGVPSMKFNWRGEPLMHPNLSEIINYAKNNGVIETIINTNATHLNNKVSEKIIQSGLDILIFSSSLRASKFSPLSVKFFTETSSTIFEKSL